MLQLAGLVQMVDHRGERGRLAGAGGAGDEDHSLVEVAELGDDRRQRQLLERGHFRGNGAERGADARFLAEHVDAEAAAFGGHVREVEVVALARNIGLVAGEDLGDVALELPAPQVAELDGQQVAMHPQHRRNADGQMHVRASLLRAELQERVDARQGDDPSIVGRSVRVLPGSGWGINELSPEI